MQLRSLLPTAVLASSLLVDGVAGRKFNERHLELMETRANRMMTSFERRTSNDSDTVFRFMTDETEPYLVESLPDVHFDLGEMYSGSIPIDKGNDSRSLFFVFQTKLGEPVDEVTIWLNGGPGCSSLEGFFQENGRFLWQPGTFLPVENPYSWVNLTNVLWVDQPVGTGFALGTPTADSEEEIAEDFVKFFKNFEELFGIKNFKIYVTGESYAGRYVPYISAAFLDQNDTEYFDLTGALTYDPCIGQWDWVQEEAPAVPFVLENTNMFNFNETFLAELEALHESCGYKEFIDEYLVFPASGVQPPKFMNWTADADCDVYDTILDEALEINPCFDLYSANVACPLLWDVLGFPGSLLYSPAGASIYFDRDDVKKAMHAPNVTWAECTGEDVFTGGDAGPEQVGDISANPIEHVLPQVIERTNRVLIANGDYDFSVLTLGTLLSIQNMTWNGKLGFQQQPNKSIVIDLPDLQYAEVLAENGLSSLAGGQGGMGIQHYERGLMWAETFQSGHMEPQYQPRVSYRHLEWLLGRIDEL
ncbi:hypothetical protein ASPZODRAFT_131918 [Penicilliopsis zonata CBS 506.65]|uniref:Carboxypeptidase n=1 Tax=Penicilliopsis zonata CBS 506.65 TaxID=1073090 RepID=A0A1L9SIG0_9EURO|nr:hypothetical protein ASPZODRAFT_131918 [Penicilliopsis zonata CBS 506.65]OJJ46999.1 hypothetical protein ASPZODRAFT_131918 [Penicilliopsis zonata CBS 506.65]